MGDVTFHCPRCDWTETVDETEVEPHGENLKKQLCRVGCDATLHYN